VSAIGDEETKKLEQAVEELGLMKAAGSLNDSADQLASLVDDTRNQSVRAKILANALVARFGTVPGAAFAAVAVLAAPLMAGLILWALTRLGASVLFSQISSTALGIATSLSAVIAVAGTWLSKVRKGLDKIDQLRASLDQEM